jgi:hypothetical protein
MLVTVLIITNCITGALLASCVARSARRADPARKAKQSDRIAAMNAAWNELDAEIAKTVKLKREYEQWNAVSGNRFKDYLR